MDDRDRAFLEAMAQRTVRTSAKPAVLEQVRHDGGLDMVDVTDSMLMALFDGRYDGDWWVVAFSFSECLAFYAGHEVLENALTERQLLAWSFCVLALADALEHGASDWELQIGILIASLCAVRDQLDPEDALWILRRTFRSSVTTT